MAAGLPSVGLAEPDVTIARADDRTRYLRTVVRRISAPPPEGHKAYPALDDADRLAFTGGLGYGFGALRADLAYQFVQLSENESSAPGIPGTYEGTAHVFGLTLGYSM